MFADKIVSPDEAVAEIRDGDTVCSSGFVGIGTPDELILALERRFLQADQPSGLTLLFAAAPGDGKDRGLNRLAHPGLLKLNLNTVFWKRVLVQALTRACVVVSITRGGFVRDDQAALASRTLGGSAMRAALNSGPMRPVAGVRRVISRPSLLIATSWSRSRSRSTSPHSGRKPAIRHRSSSSLRRTSARKEQNT